MDTREANIIVHTRMAATYDEREPHFFPENRKKVRGMLESLRPRSGGRLLDLGCGTGFILSLAQDLFDELHGVDITEAMLQRVDVSGGNITLHCCGAEKVPFTDGFFDMVTAYSFLHHLDDYRAVLREAFRVLKEGGIFYVDLEPNRAFWQLASQYDGGDAGGYGRIAGKEIASVCHTDRKVSAEYGIAPEVFNQAEPLKSVRGGIDGDQFREDALAAGFTRCTTAYQWYAGQGAVIHEQSEKEAGIIDSYLRSIFPFSKALFKYLQFIITK